MSNLRARIMALETKRQDEPPPLPHLWLEWNGKWWDLLHGGLSFEDGGPGCPIESTYEVQDAERANIET